MYNNQFFAYSYRMDQSDYLSFNSMWRNTVQKFAALSGTVTMIEDFYTGQDDASTGCYKLISIETVDMGPVKFIISPETYFVNHVVIDVGDDVTGFYDANAPVMLIYPPQYRAIVMARNTGAENVTVDYFNNQLLSNDGNLQLLIGSSTEVILTNDQIFNMYPWNRNLIVVYGPTTFSIPAQTTPYKIIVLC